MIPMVPVRRLAVFVLAAAVVATCGSAQPTPLSASPASQPSGRPTPASESASSSVIASPSAGAPEGSPASIPPARPFEPAGLAISLEPLAGGLEQPVGVVNAGDGSGRVFIVEKVGTVRVVRDGQVRSEPFLDISGDVSFGGEQGLLGLAFHPDFPDDPRVFIDYTDAAGDTRIVSFRVDPSDDDRVDPGSRVELLFVDQPYRNHNGGAVAFGPDGYLHIGMGDGGSGGDPHGNGQKLGTLLGKILRIDVDAGGGGSPYGIPADNPFVETSSARPELFAIGLRNPWRLSFDRVTGDLWIGDVGQNAYEEIDVMRAGTSGQNFGWNRMEGAHCYRPAERCDQSGLVLPVVEYSHGEGGCTVIGGYVYRGAAQPDLAGGYLFGDYCSGFIWAIDSAGDARREATLVADTELRISSFGEDEAGELYVTDISRGELLRVVASRD
jgi:glucose/arabinose dehydrogenase